MSHPTDGVAVSEQASENVQPARSNGDQSTRSKGDQSTRSNGDQSTGGSDVARLEERLDALERTLTDGEPVAELDDLSDLDDRLTALEESATELEETVAELEAAMQAVRGYVGSIRAVNEEVERRADLALARAERLERYADLPAGDPTVPDPDAVAAAIPDDEPAGRENGETSIDGDVLSRLRDAL